MMGLSQARLFYGIESFTGKKVSVQICLCSQRLISRGSFNLMKLTVYISPYRKLCDVVQNSYLYYFTLTYQSVYLYYQ
jgi:hypothetical protein